MTYVAALIAALALSLGGPIEEDSPIFNCRIDGNQICGPDAPAHGFVNLPDLH